MEGFWAVGDFNNFLKFYYIYKIFLKKKLEKGGLINIMDVLLFFFSFLTCQRRGSIFDMLQLDFFFFFYSLEHITTI